MIENGKIGKSERQPETGNNRKIFTAFSGLEAAMKLRDIYDPAFFMARSLPPRDRHPEPPSDHGITKPDKLKVEVSTSPQDHDPANAEQIVNAWRQIMGMELNVTTVRAHLETLKRWHSPLDAVPANGRQILLKRTDVETVVKQQRRVHGLWRLPRDAVQDGAQQPDPLRAPGGPARPS